MPAEITNEEREDDFSDLVEEEKRRIAERSERLLATIDLYEARLSNLKAGLSEDGTERFS